jgi:hypothetical protein
MEDGKGKMEEKRTGKKNWRLFISVFPFLFFHFPFSNHG